MLKLLNKYDLLRFIISAICFTLVAAAMHDVKQSGNADKNVLKLMSELGYSQQSRAIANDR